MVIQTLIPVPPPKLSGLLHSMLWLFPVFNRWRKSGVLSPPLRYGKKFSLICRKVLIFSWELRQPLKIITG